ncbi:unnamed protein product [Effrenium voratum]|nr:unnamed protein product [Effrenium voratum]
MRGVCVSSRWAASTAFRLPRKTVAPGVSPVSPVSPAAPASAGAQRFGVGAAPARNDGPPLAEGQAKMKIGKYQGKTFADIYQEDPQYCRWACDVALKGNSSDAMKIFAAYVQHRWLLALNNLLKHAQPNSLTGHSLATTGENDELMRSVIESYIRILGGNVSRRLSDATALVTLGPRIFDGRPVKESPKMKEEKCSALSQGRQLGASGAEPRGFAGLGQGWRPH